MTSAEIEMDQLTMNLEQLEDNLFPTRKLGGGFKFLSQ
jgi:hypothetical protein